MSLLQDQVCLKLKIMKSFYSPQPELRTQQLSSVAPVQRDAGAKSLLSCSPGAGAGYGDLSGVQQTSNKCGPVIISLRLKLSITV